MTFEKKGIFSSLILQINEKIICFNLKEYDTTKLIIKLIFDGKIHRESASL